MLLLVRNKTDKSNPLISPRIHGTYMTRIVYLDVPDMALHVEKRTSGVFRDPKHHACSSKKHRAQCPSELPHNAWWTKNVMWIVCERVITNLVIATFLFIICILQSNSRIVRCYELGIDSNEIIELLPLPWIESPFPMNQIIVHYRCSLKFIGPLAMRLRNTQP
jgi:hypothetical protein